MAEYAQLAEAHGLTPASLALAWVKQQPGVASTLVGATSLTQLAENLAAFELTLSDELLAGIEAIHRRYPNPAF